MLGFEQVGKLSQDSPKFAEIMRQVKLATGASDEEMVQLAKQARQFGITTSLAAVDVAEDMLELVQQGSNLRGFIG